MSDLQKQMMKKKAEAEGEKFNPYDSDNISNSSEEDDVAELNEFHSFANIKKQSQQKPIAPTQKIDFGNNSNKMVEEPMDKKETDDISVEYTKYFSREFMDNGTPVYMSGNSGPIFLCMHGAGHSALSFALLSKEVTKFARLASFDFRGHGNSKVAEDANILLIDNLISDALEVLHYLAVRFPEATFVILGHSMGGSVAARACHEAKQIEENDLKTRVVGLLVIDVVEGTAIEALPYMEAILNKRPQKFKSVTDAIEWSLQSRTLLNKESAKVSIPPQLIQKPFPPKGDLAYTWKNDLMASEKYWMGWFTGLSKVFLGVSCPKLLVLRGKEIMDTELTVAQMQGKFKVVCFPGEVGHCMMEDDPRQTAITMHMFLEKFRLPQSVED